MFFAPPGWACWSAAARRRASMASSARPPSRPSTTASRSSASRTASSGWSQGDAEHFRPLAIDDVKGHPSARRLDPGHLARPTRPSPKSDMDNVLDALRRLGVTHAGDDRRRRHGLFGQPGLPPRPAGPSASPTCPRPSTTICRCPARRRPSASRRPGSWAWASSATWPRTPGPPRAGI